MKIFGIAATLILLAACAPPPQLSEGDTYWVKGPPGWQHIDLFTTPAEETQAMCGYLTPATEVLLVKQDGKWCYVKGETNRYPEEGWLGCTSLVDHYITPIPTPIRTPQRP